uniref:Uncharacterized protein n=1 Tax=Tanacetum cinerariifolium TaxID=118510 RepID=A0A699JGM4_TANCI|nr:hypothetical protein [Tanacetum cinerariifolium]
MGEALRLRKLKKKSGGGGGAVVVVLLGLWWWCCCGGVVVLWWCGGGAVVGGGVVLLLWLLFGSGVVLVNMENYEDDLMTLTCRSKLKLIKLIRTKFRNTFREELFRNTERYEVRPIPFRRLVFDSDTDGGHVTGQMLIDNINGEEFDNLHDETWIFEVYNIAALRYYTHQQLYPRAVAWSKVTTFQRKFLRNFFAGARPNRRLRPDAFEARAKWWVRSREFFDGRIHEAPPIPTPVKLRSRYDVPKYIDPRYKELIDSIKELKKKNDAHEKLLKEVYKFYQGQSKPKPLEVLNTMSYPTLILAFFKTRRGCDMTGLKPSRSRIAVRSLTWPKGPQRIRRCLRSQFRLGILPLIPTLHKLRPLWHYKDLPRGLLPIRPVLQ